MNVNMRLVYSLREIKYIYIFQILNRTIQLQLMDTFPFQTREYSLRLCSIHILPKMIQLKELQEL